MKIVVLTKLGGVRTLPLAPWTLCAVLSLAVAAIAATAIQLHERFSHHRHVTQALADWQAGVIDQQAAVTQLQQQQAAENEAISKQLANMQGRLWRMEALGQWVTEASGLDAGEFDFAAPPAQGGPLSEVPADCARTDATQTLAACQEAVLPRSDLHARLNELAGQIRQREDEFELFESLLKAPAEAVGQSTNVRPVNWGWVSSPYGRRIDPISGKMAWHTGVDFAGRRGSDVVAVDRGIVAFAGFRQGYGNLVELAHLDGHVTRYAHQGSLAVSRGDIVRQGQVIGTVGNTGRSTGPHVHFEVLRNGRHLNPMKYLKDRGS
ncbi:MAG: M23 family metallopeptidase [Gammaproteobacteria bacterium]|nr:M23 family metallopeptidase [Gammaproteobacteria bacterium]